MRTEKKQELAERRHRRVRQKVFGTAQRPRMSVCFTGKHVYVQFIDDLRGHTLAAVSTANPQRPDQAKLAANAATAEQVGQWAAEAARTQGIVQVVFDRGAAQYHGKVKALADAARAAGLKF